MMKQQQKQKVVVDNTSIASDNISSTFNSRNQKNSHNAASMNSSYGTTTSSSSRNNRNLWSRLRQQVRRGSHLLEAASVADTATVTREGTTKQRTIFKGNTEDTSHNEGYADEDEDDEDRILNELTSLLADSRMQDMGNVGGDGDNDDADTVDNATRSSSEELRDAAIRTFQHQSTISPQLCLLMILVYIMLSICIFHFLLEPKWTIIDSSYFAVVTFTTLGYGDLTPTSTIGEVFTAGYALAGVACLGIAIGIIGDQFMEVQEERRLDHETSYMAEIMTLFHPNPNHHDPDHPDPDPNHDHDHVHSHDTTTPNHEIHTTSDSDAATQKNTNNDTNTNKNHNNSPTHHRHRRRHHHLHHFFSKSWFIFKRIVHDVRITVWQHRSYSLIGIVAVLGYVIAHRAGWTFWTAVYYSIITGCTIGYGDFVPTTQEGRLAGIFFVLFSVCLFGHYLAHFANWVVNSKSSYHLKHVMEGHTLTMKDIKILDLTGDGQVQWYEFLEVMLVILGKVDSELIDELREYFDQLDVNGSGILCQEDLIEIARRNLRNCTKRKLELHTYKRTLMEKARREKQQQKEQQRRQSSYSSRGGRQSSISSFFSSFSITNDTATAAAAASTRSNSCNDSNVVGAGGRDRRTTLGLILQRTKQRTERFTRGPSMRSRASSDTSINQH